MLAGIDILPVDRKWGMIHIEELVYILESTQGDIS